jgi:hypothetical protein
MQGSQNKWTIQGAHRTSRLGTGSSSIIIIIIINQVRVNQLLVKQQGS